LPGATLGSLGSALGGGLSACAGALCTGTETTLPAGTETARTAGTETAGTKAAVSARPTLSGSAVVMHLASATVVMAVVMPATCARAEDEPGAEDDGDDEHDASHDADPCGNGVELRASSALLDVSALDDGRRVGGGRGRCRGGAQGAGDWFW
jgi:hypothetical protein